jgi:hypothetical protein
MATGSGMRGTFCIGGGVADLAVVETESMVEAAAPPGVNDGGLNEALAAVGNPETENVTGLANPPVAGVTPIVKLAGVPAGTVTGLAGPDSEKSIPEPLSATV